jgi:hypothetical protein
MAGGQTDKYTQRARQAGSTGRQIDRLTDNNRQATGRLNSRQTDRQMLGGNFTPIIEKMQFPPSTAFDTATSAGIVEHFNTALLKHRFFSTSYGNVLKTFNPSSDCPHVNGRPVSTKKIYRKLKNKETEATKISRLPIYAIDGQFRLVCLQTDDFRLFLRQQKDKRQTFVCTMSKR